MWRLPLGQPSEDRIIGHLSARLELLQPAQECAQPLQPSLPGPRVIALVTVASGPGGHEFHRQGTAMAGSVDMAREAA